MRDYTITNYEQADALLTGRNHASRKIANNTYLERRDDSIAVRLHATDVVTYYPNGSVRLNTGGWFTVTTKDRIHRFCPATVGSIKGRWYVNGTIPFADNMLIDANGVPFGVPNADEVAAMDAANAKIKRDIRNWMRSITADDVLAALDLESRAGDCLLCLMESDDCLASHLDERYLHGTLIERAATARGYGDPGYVLYSIKADAERGRVDRFLTDSLSRFLRKHIIQGVAVA